MYKKLIEKFENQGLPSADKLANILLGKEFGLTKNTKDVAVEVFIRSLEQLNILITGVLVLEANVNESKKINEQEDIKEKTTIQDIITIFTPYITRGGKRIWAKQYGLKAFCLKIPKDKFRG